MRTKIDRFGRIVVPKELRKSFGLAPGVQVDINAYNQELVIRRVSIRSPLQVKDGLLIFEGEPAGDIASWLRKVRDDRHMKILAGT